MHSSHQIAKPCKLELRFEALQTIAGVWWKVAVWNGHPVFCKHLSDEIKLFMYFTGSIATGVIQWEMAASDA